MVNTYPLVTRDLNAPIAFLTKPIEALGLPAGQIDTRAFLSHVTDVADALGDGKHAINLCANRYLFLVGLCASILRGHTNLLPPNKNVATQEQLADTYDNCYIIHDGTTISGKLPSVDITGIALSKRVITETPEIDNDHLACISFTSGSTGQSKPNLKYWRTLHKSSKINFKHMLPPAEETVFQLATMPAQHMWGLETSILLPMFDDICLSDAQPLYPQDILDTLAALPSPKALVSTPVHLRALNSDASSTETLSSVLCATSPLTTQLATAVEKQFNCSLFEVFGCSEVGSMAVRRTATEQVWLRFDGINFTADGDTTTASADHLPEPTVLSDKIEYLGEQHFKLAGRTSDLIKIAGKRGSLFEINQVLLRYEGLKDGIVVNPQQDSEDGRETRLCAIVALKDGFDKASLTRFLREHLDSAFVPRPIYVIDDLPREPNGKLLKANITKLLAELRG